VGGAPHAAADFGRHGAWAVECPRDGGDRHPRAPCHVLDRCRHTFSAAAAMSVRAPPRQV